MAGESQLPPESVPDPSVLSTEAMTRAIRAERDYVDGQLDVLRERLRGIDRATQLLDEGVHRVPTETQQAVGNLHALMDEKFASIETQFKERDTRSEREARDNKIAVDAAFAANKVAVDAAFAAQKEAAANENKSNQKAIDRSEAGTAETINKLSDLRQATTDALAQQLADQKERHAVEMADMKERVGRSETAISNIAATKQGGKETLTGIYALVAFLVTVLVLGTALAAAGVFGK